MVIDELSRRIYGEKSAFSLELEKISDRIQASMCVNEDGFVEVCEECEDTGHGCTCTNNLNAYDWEE